MVTEAAIEQLDRPPRDRLIPAGNRDGLYLRAQTLEKIGRPCRHTVQICDMTDTDAKFRLGQGSRIGQLGRIASNCRTYLRCAVE
jgi:hypothetical protein